MFFVKSGKEFLPGFRLSPALGHRYDQSILKVTSSDEQLVHISDAIVHPLFMANSYWHSTYDANPAQAVETKTKLLKLYFLAVIYIIWQYGRKTMTKA